MSLEANHNATILVTSLLCSAPWVTLKPRKSFCLSPLPFSWPSSLGSINRAKIRLFECRSSHFHVTHKLLTQYTHTHHQFSESGVYSMQNLSTLPCTVRIQKTQSLNLRSWSKNWSHTSYSCSNHTLYVPQWLAPTNLENLLYCGLKF